MKILIVGSGGREHALAWKLKRSNQIFIAPGNAGTAQIGQNIDIAADDLKSLLGFAQKEKIDLTVVGPEIPLSLGIVDLFEKNRLPIFGPSKKAAQIESSKIFSKRFMKKLKIPTADFKVFSDYQKAKKYLENCQFPKVIKADGLAAGKGVFVCQDLKTSLSAIRQTMLAKKFGQAGSKIIIEDCLVGQEASIICLTDGQTILPFLPAQDHKPIFDGDQGPNTGGMGAYAPTPIINNKLMNQIIRQVLKPTIQGMKKIDRPFKGVLYAGLMLTDKGLKVLEFNCRFGDPETQPQLMLLKSDLTRLMLSCINGKLKTQKLNWHPGSAVCITLASGGYPGNYQKGFEIKGLNKKTRPNTQIFHAATKTEKNKIVTNGGRVLGITCRAPTLKQAIKKTYSAVEKINFKKKYYRTDIAAKGLQQNN